MTSPRFAALVLAMFAFVTMGGAMTARASETEPATLVITNGKIVTMDEHFPRAEALAIEGEWIVQVGTLAEIKPRIGASTQVVDVGGRLVVPGFNDAHCHFADGAALLRSLNLYGVTSKEQVLQMVAAKVAQAEPGEWILGSRYDHTLWGEEWPTKEDLDRVAPRNPVCLSRASGHSVWVNSKALELSGITRNTASPHAGEIQKDPRTGEPTGILLESALELLKMSHPQLSEEEKWRRQKDDLVAGFRHANMLGVTSVQTSSSLEELALVRELQAEGARTLRWNGWLTLGDARRLAAQGLCTGQGDLWVRIGFLKGFIDGTLGDGTASMFEPFADRKESSGLPTMTQAQLDEAVLEADRLGFQIGIHAIGDRGSHLVLNAYEKAALVNGTRDKRHRIEHSQLIHPDDIRRFGQLGVVASMQPTHCTTDMRFAETRVGFERCKTGYAWRSLLESGAVLAFGTDWSVEPLDPMRGIFSAVTRTNIESMEPKTGWFPEQKLTVWESIRYYTWGSAHGEHLENVKGTLAPGRLADLVVLEKDLFAITPEEILTTRVDITVVGGRVVWDRSRNAWNP
ncbi:MAG: amidohydrolase family protein [Planctomycetota bacterium]